LEASVGDLKFVAETLLPTKLGTFRVRAYRDTKTGQEPIALLVGEVKGLESCPVRVHDQCMTSEVLGSLKCDCKGQLDQALASIQALGKGVVVYLAQEGRGIGLANKVAAYALQEQGFDTVDANRQLGLPDDARVYGHVKSILQNLEVKSIQLMTNNPRKIRRLSELGIQITERVSCTTTDLSGFSKAYLKAKVSRMGHMISEKEINPEVQV